MLCSQIFLNLTLGPVRSPPIPGIAFVHSLIYFISRQSEQFVITKIVAIVKIYLIRNSLFTKYSGMSLFERGRNEWLERIYHM